MEEWSGGELDLDEARRRLEDVSKQIEGEIAEAEDAEEVRVVLRRVIADINVKVGEDNDGRRHLLVAVTLHGHDLPTMLLGGHPDEVSEMLPALLGSKP